MEWKDGRLQLPNVTLMAMTSVNVRQTIKAMQYSMRQIDFGDCVLILSLIHISEPTRRS